jgi:hypothetical protein
MTPPVAQEPSRGEHHRADPDNKDQMSEINVIFKGSMLIASKTQGKNPEGEISLAQRIESGRRMKWPDVDISFRPEDHPETELSDRNLPFVIKLPIGRHKVDKTLIDSGASLNLIMRKTFIEMGLNRSDLTLVHDTFHGVILGQLSTPNGRIDLDISCGTEDNKHREILTFKVASFDIGYSCILGRSLLLKFGVVIHTAYTTMKMPGPKGVTTVRADQRDTLACENATLSHAEQFSEKAAQEQSANVAKMQGGSILLWSSTAKPPIAGTPRTPLAKKGIYAASPSTQHPANQSMDDKKKGGQTQGDPS